MLPNITIIDRCKVRIAAFECNERGKVSQKTIDLTSYAGQHVRIWLDTDVSYSLDPKKGHYWQVAEFDVPEIQFSSVDTGETDEAGQAVMASEPLPLDLADTEIKTWRLPE